MKRKLVNGICAAGLLVLSGCDMAGMGDGVLTGNDYTAAQTSERETESEENSPYWEVEISPGHTLSFLTSTAMKTGRYRYCQSTAIPQRNI